MDMTIDEIDVRLEELKQTIRPLIDEVNDLMAQKGKVASAQRIADLGLTKAGVQLSSGPGVPEGIGTISSLKRWMKDSGNPKKYFEGGGYVFSVDGGEAVCVYDDLS